MLSLILAGSVMYYMGVYAYKNYFQSSPQFKRKITKEFKKIGTIKEIFVYPIDGGPGHSVKSAYCTKTGIKSGQHRDRWHIAYSPLHKVAFLNVRHPELATQNLNQLWYDLARFPFLREGEIQINYLGRTIKVQDHWNEVADSALDVLGDVLVDPLGVRIGFCSPENRQHFNENKAKHPDGNPMVVGDVDDFSPYFASYTLINSESLQYLKEKTNTKVKPGNFRANIVIEGLDAFGEDNIFCLKIGKLFFYNVKPCTHVPSAFIEHSSVENPEKLEPYQYLRNRPLNDVRPPMDGVRFPTFGVTMELGPVKPYTYPQIYVGDVVEAQLYYKED